MPVKKSAALSVRRRFEERNRTSPSSASRHSGNSADGSAWAIEPATVPRLRIWKCEMCGNASASSGSSCARRGRHSTLACVAAAPMRSQPESMRTSASGVEREMSTSRFGCARRMFITAISDWPPARMRASPPSSASAATAISALSARW